MECEREGCESKVKARGLCFPHYIEARRNGLPLLTPDDRLWRQVIKGPNCWGWTGKLNHDGYVRVRYQGTLWYGHRLIYTLLVGPIPDGMELDHLCGVRSCTNPQHLEPVTRTENVARSSVGRVNRSKTHCPQGHPYSGDNLKINKNGARQCVACLRAAQDRYKSTRREVLRDRTRERRARMKLANATSDPVPVADVPAARVRKRT